MPSRILTPTATPAPRVARASATARPLSLRDVPALRALECDKWGEPSAATCDDLVRRIEAFPELSIGAFCERTDRLVASLFMKPALPDFWQHAGNWRDGVEGATPSRTRSLFGISLSSRDAAGVDAILGFFWPRALAQGWRHIYLGSPIPGWSGWRRRHPRCSVADYVARTTARGLPLDPQLRYYHGRGFTKVVCVKPGYFPHARSHDHGVILRGTVPLSALSPLWRTLGARRTQCVTDRLTPLLLR
jgi:hypothetical protein